MSDPKPAPTAVPTPSSPPLHAGHGAAGHAGEPPAGAATLSRELSDFLVEFAIALHKHAIYPPGHPLLDAAVESVTRRLGALLAVRTVLSIGIARKQLVIEGVATDPSHPLLLELAQKLHRHHLGAVKLLQGVGRAELAQALATLGTDMARMERPLGLETESLAERWPHVRLFPLSYDRLELLDDDERPAPGEDRASIGRAAQLWVGLARAALASEADDQEDALEPVAVARAIEEHKREQAYDQVIVGYLLQIANELKAAEGVESAGLQRRISKMVAELNPETLTRLLEMGGDDRQRRRFILDATQGMAVNAVVDLVQAAADVERQTVSHSMVRMLTKLAQHAEQDQGDRRVEADRSLREAVTRLVTDWSLDDPNPDAYRVALETIARSTPAPSLAEEHVDCEPERMLQMALEVGVVGEAIRRAVDRLAAAGRLTTVLDMLDAAPDAAAADVVWRHVSARGTLRELLAADRIDFALVQRLVRREGIAAVPTLLDAVDASDDAKTRERLHAELLIVGMPAGPLIARRIADATPVIQRELLALVGRLPRLPAELDLEAYLAHPDGAVRREAVKLLLRERETRESTMLAALADADDRIVFVALQATQDGCSRAAIELLRARVDRGELDAGLRAHAIRVIATQHTPETLQWLLRRVVTTTKWLKRPKLLPSSPEMLAALAAISASWRGEPAAASVIALAKRRGVKV